MKLKNKYNFKEVQLGKNFAADKLKSFKRLIEDAISFVVISMPGVGVSYFLKYLASQDFARFFHVDMYSLPFLTQHEFYKLLLTELGGNAGKKTDDQLLYESKKILSDLSQKHQKIVIIFSRFDQLKKELDWNLLSNIQSLTTINPDKIVLIFTSTKFLTDLAPEAVRGGNLNFYSKILYFKPYSKQDLKKLLSIEPDKQLNEAILDKILDLSGGHNQLLHILLSSQKQQNLLLDQFVKLQMKELLDPLDYQQRKTLQKIALGKKVEEIDDFLLEIGIAQKKNSKYGLFTPLLAQYLRTNLPVKLPVKEAKLFKLLRKNMDNVVSKDEIFAEVWAENDQNATDWALDALIYRLRKHPFIKSNNYIIESHKKVGYTLIQT